MFIINKLQGKKNDSRNCISILGLADKRVHRWCHVYMYNDVNILFIYMRIRVYILWYKRYGSVLWFSTRCSAHDVTHFLDEYS